MAHTTNGVNNITPKPPMHEKVMLWAASMGAGMTGVFFITAIWAGDMRAALTGVVVGVGSGIVAGIRLSRIEAREKRERYQDRWARF